MSQTRTGLANVYRRASHYPEVFHGWVDENVIHVSDLAIGTYVLVLPRRPEDLGWAPVVVNECTGVRKCARFTWLHPQCLEYLTSDNNAILTIGHTDGRGGSQGSHNIGTPSPGTRRYNNDLVLDARWRGRQGSGSCKGYCYNVVVEMMRDPERMADILDFASEQERGLIACAHGTHRSVAAVQILQHFFHRHVNYRLASRDNCRCGAPAWSSIDELSNAARQLAPPKNLALLKDMWTIE